MASNVKILLVDDNPMVLGMLQQALSALGEVTVATDGADALLKAVDDLPDVLISDYRMPGMDGRQLLEKLKSPAGHGGDRGDPDGHQGRHQRTIVDAGSD